MSELTPSQRISQYIDELGDWRGTKLAWLRELVLEVDPEITEEWKWETPVWSHKYSVLAFGAFQDHIKINFFKGAALEDPHGLFNAGLDAKKTRAIDLYQGDEISDMDLKDLVRSAVAFQASSR